MAQVQYTGHSDFRILGPQDLTKVGVEDFETTIFPRHELVEVSPQVAQLLESDHLFGGEFFIIDGQDIPESQIETLNATVIEDEVVSAAEVTETGASQESTGTQSETGTRKGRSSTP